MIKNQTPYSGKIRLKFEKHPHYSSGSNKLNKVHLNLGFTKLVSRIDTREPRPEAIASILNTTGLRIETHTFGPKGEHSLENSCMHPDGGYVGDLERGYWYLKNGLTAKKGTHVFTAWKKSTKQWVGYSHRAACAFGKGDRLFDATWVPGDDELLQYERYFAKHLGEIPEGQTLNEWAVGHIPFRQRGAKVIKTYEEAQIAAANFAKYVG
jgi:hypothetical protein